VLREGGWGTQYIFNINSNDNQLSDNGLISSKKCRKCQSIKQTDISNHIHEVWTKQNKIIKSKSGTIRE